MNSSYYQRKCSKYRFKCSAFLQTGGQNTDLNKIISIAKNVQILGMSEATHGQEKINQFRVMVFKALVKKCGYNVFVLEDQYSCCELINHYIKTGEGQPIKLVLNLMYFWGSHQILELIKWMRKYNKKHNNILEFKGIDIQTVCDEYNNKKDKMTNIIENIYQKYEKADQDNWIEADGARDKSMYQVFMKFYNKSSKYFIIAHNFHLAKKDVKEGLSEAKWLGYYLTNTFGSNYYAIGNIFKKGRYLETPDLIETGIDYKWLKGSDNFIIINQVPQFIGINVNKLHNGLNILSRNSPYDAIFVINNETPLKLAKLY